MATDVPKIVAVISAYWTISISMVFANKYLVGDRQSDIDVSLFVAWVQCIVTVVFVICMEYGKAAMKGQSSELQLQPSSVLKPQIMIMTCSYVSMLTFNNLCLRHVGVAFYQVARSLTLIFVVILSVVLLKKSVSWRIVLCCVTVASGFVLGSDQESLAGTFSVLGMFYGVISSLFIALNGIFTKRALDVVDRDSVKLTLYNNINAIILFLPFVIGTGQLQSVLSSTAFLSDVYFWCFLLSSGVLAFMIAWISAVQIDITSPVTHHISANSKAVLQTVIAVVYYQQQKSLLWWCSILLVVGGALSYAVIRIREEKNESANKTAPLNEAERGDKPKNGILK